MAIQTGSSIRWCLLLLSLLLTSCSWLYQAPAPIVKVMPLEETTAPQSIPAEATAIANDASDTTSSEQHTD